MPGIEQIKGELDKIRNPVVKRFARLVLSKALQHSMKATRSSGAKHQPLKFSELAQRAKATCYFGDKLCSAYSIEGDVRDFVVVACILCPVIRSSFGVGFVKAVAQDFEGISVIDGVVECLVNPLIVGGDRKRDEVRLSPARNNVQTIASMAYAMSRSRQAGFSDGLKSDCKAAA